MALDHTPPDHALDAEDALISECLADTSLIEGLGLKPGQFFSPSSKILFEAAIDFHARGEASVAPEALVDHLHRKGRLADVGGKAGVARAIGAVPSSPDVAPLAQIVKEAAQVRALDTVLTKLQARCRGAVGDRASLLAEARAAVEAVTEGAGRNAIGLPVTDVSEIPAELPPPAHVSERLHLAPGRPSCLVGYAGAGKTMLAADLAQAVSAPEGSGATFWGGLTVDRHGKVLMLDFEVGEYLTRQRLLRLATGRWGNLKDWAGRLSFSCFPRWSLVAPSAEERLIATLKGHVLCVIDSLAAITPGIDENSKEMADYMALLTRASEATGCAILVLHHEGKPPQDGPRAAHLRGRGSSAIQGIWASQWAVTSLGEGKLQLEHGKTQWDGGLRPSHLCQIVDVGERGPTGFPGVRLAPAGPQESAAEGSEPAASQGSIGKAKRQILNFLGANGESTSGAMKKALKHINNDAYSIAVRELVDEDKKITRTPKGATKVYALTSSQPHPNSTGMKSGETSSPSHPTDDEGDQ